MDDKPVNPSVWHVMEMVEYEPPTQTKTECFVLAVSAKEAVEIVGEDERRQIIAVNQVCALSQLPGDKYRAMPIAHKLRGGVVAQEQP